MVCLNINPPAMKLIDFLHVDTHDKIKTCIDRYTIPKTFSGDFVYLLHRIWNSVKSLFGLSDWQIARKAIIDIEFKDPGQLFRKILSDDKELNKIQADILLEAFKKSTKLDEKEISKNKVKIAEEFLEDILDANTKEPELPLSEEEKKKTSKVPIPDRALTQLIKAKEHQAFIAQFRNSNLKDLLAEELTLDAMKKTLAETPPAEREEMLNLFVHFGISVDDYRVLKSTMVSG